MDRPMMRIGELAERAGVSRRSLRYYERHGLLHASRTDRGWRLYDEVALARAANVRDLLAAGLRMEDVQHLAPCLERDLEQGPACDEAIEMRRARVNALAPGPTESEALERSGRSATEVEHIKDRERARIPLGRRGEPNEVAHWILALVDPAAGWVTGQVIDVDGGFGLA